MPLDRLLDRRDVRFRLHRLDAVGRGLDALVAAVDVGKDGDPIADRAADRLDDCQVLRRLAGHLDLQPANAVGGDLGRFLRRQLGRRDPDAVAQRYFAAHGAAEQLIHRHAQAAPHDVEQGALDHRLGVGIAADFHVGPGQDVLDRKGVRAFQHGGKAFPEQVADDARVLAEVAAVLAAPAQDRRRLAQAGDAHIRGDLQDHITPDRHLERAPGIGRAPR